MADLVVADVPAPYLIPLRAHVHVKEHPGMVYEYIHRENGSAVVRDLMDRQCILHVPFASLSLALDTPCEDQPPIKRMRSHHA
jgi:hypothetical protein